MTTTQTAALDRINREGTLYAYNGVSIATVRALYRAGMVTLTGSASDWVARPVAK
jgi:hypothetical protein